MLPHWTVLLLSLAPLSLARRSTIERGHLLAPIGGYEIHTLRHRAEPSISAPVIDVNAAPSSAASTSGFTPDPSTIAAASRNTTALQYAQYLDSITTDNCTVAGGGCTQLSLTLGDCVADDCVCQNEYTLAAMICAQCIATKEAIMVYNTYLNYCDREGIADPTDTFGVSMEPSGVGGMAAVTVTSFSQIMTTIQVPASGGVSSGASSGPSAGPSLGGGVMAIGGLRIQSSPPESSTTGGPLVDPSGLPSNLPASSGAAPSISTSGGPLVLQAVQVSASGSVVSSGGSSGGSLVSSAGPSVPTSAGGPPMTELEGINFAAVPSSTAASTSSLPFSSGGVLAVGLSGTSALNAAIAFFSAVTVTQCEDKCTVWKGLSNTCTQDQCICTAAGVSSAASCSSCIGSGSNGVTPPDLQANYAAFMGNCSAEGGIVVPSGSIGPTGFEMVAPASSVGSMPSDLGAGPSPSVSIPPHINAAEQQAIITVTSHADSRLDRSLAFHSWTMVVGIVGVVAGGLLVL